MNYFKNRMESSSALDPPRKFLKFWHEKKQFYTFYVCHLKLINFTKHYTQIDTSSQIYIMKRYLV